MVADATAVVASVAPAAAGDLAAAYDWWRVRPLLWLAVGAATLPVLRLRLLY